MKKNTIHKNKVRKDCWNLDMSFFLWLKERLPVYLKDAGKIVNLDYRKFNIDGKELTQKEVIKIMIEDLDCITSHYIDDWSHEYDEKVNHLMECWSKIVLYMWW